MKDVVVNSFLRLGKLGAKTIPSLEVRHIVTLVEDVTHGLGHGLVHQFALLPHLRCLLST